MAWADHEKEGVDAKAAAFVVAEAICSYLAGSK